MKKTFKATIYLVCAFTLSFCSSLSHIPKKDFQSLTTPDGQPKSYLTASNVGLYLFGVYPIYHRSDLIASMQNFSTEAKKNKAKKIKIIQKDITKWYIVYPPFSFIITPVSSEVFGAIY
ncbi:MAG: hypothetical protein AAF518_00295 [Spirochaetota bacterium]